MFVAVFLQRSFVIGGAVSTSSNAPDICTNVFGPPTGQPDTHRMSLATVPSYLKRDVTMDVNHFIRCRLRSAQTITAPIRWKESVEQLRPCGYYRCAAAAWRRANVSRNAFPLIWLKCPAPLRLASLDVESSDSCSAIAVQPFSYILRKFRGSRTGRVFVGSTSGFMFHVVSLLTTRKIAPLIGEKEKNTTKRTHGHSSMEQRLS